MLIIPDGDMTLAALQGKDTACDGQTGGGAVDSTAEGIAWKKRYM